MNGEVGADTLIVIGSSNREGDESRFSNRFSSVITAYAPGEDILVLDHDGGYYDVQSGTSVSAALVSGLIANWLTRIDVAAKLNKTDTMMEHYTKKIKAFVKEVAAYATGPQSDIKVVGTHDYVPCDTPLSRPAPLSKDPPCYTVRDKTGMVYSVPGAQCVGVSSVRSSTRWTV
ncbi:hypothetical protein B0T16DRAFT_421382 [Cercophora newfieldiana]|uniref:Peptidase S8/S53 domain-containing protein n=1 Tax=Cercophora newfieldiana TaxID=92897 RepID=A0AA40CH24_9PEZI|nr:hypothetical protein B0T16DRAFT_421382 [Cercophora newfieldiana]